MFDTSIQAIITQICTISTLFRALMDSNSKQSNRLTPTSQRLIKSTEDIQHSPRFKVSDTQAVSGI